MTIGDERVSDLLEGPLRRNRREIASPEGVPLVVEIADFGERATAFVLDVFFMALVVAFVALVAFAVFFSTMSVDTGAVMVALLVLVAFFTRVFYFIHFELAWQGATPGKRIVGLRVIDRRGAPLKPAAVIARNLTREIEMFLPFQLLVGIGSGRVAVWEQLALALWALLFTFMPFINRDRMRAGDLIAGTIVVSLRRRALLGDLVDTTFHHSFSEKQLRAYGALELQVLEEVLRRPDGIDTRRFKAVVAEKIIRKIAWPAPVAEKDIDLFLRDFYTAERAFLEREQLFGKPRADQHAQEKPGG